MIGISDLLNHSDSSDQDANYNTTKPGSRASRASLSDSGNESNNSGPYNSNLSSSKGSSSSTPSVFSTTSSASTSGSNTSYPSNLATAKTSPKLAPEASSSAESVPTSNPQILAIPKSKINKRFLVNKTFVKLAIRRKSVSKKLSHRQQTLFEKALQSDSSSGERFIAPLNANSKLHVKSLEAGLKVKLSLATNLLSLYHSLIPFTNKKEIFSLYQNTSFESFEGNVASPSASKNSIQCSNFSKRALVSKSVKLIDNNLVDLSGFSNKILQTFNLVSGSSDSAKERSSDIKLETNSEESTVSSPTLKNKNGEPFLTTFNSLDTAVHTLFGIKEYSLIRVTRSTTDDYDGSVVLKLESAHAGDTKLVDEVDFMDEMLYSLGNKGSVPSNLFIKKVVARPRYKSDMKIYLIPQKVNCALYTDERMFERDLINGIIDINDNEDEDSLNKPMTDNLNRDVFVTFPYRHIVKEYKRLLNLSKEFDQQDASAAKETAASVRPSLDYSTSMSSTSSISYHPPTSRIDSFDSLQSFQQNTSSTHSAPLPPIYYASSPQVFAQPPHLTHHQSFPLPQSSHLQAENHPPPPPPPASHLSSPQAQTSVPLAIAPTRMQSFGSFSGPSSFLPPIPDTSPPIAKSMVVSPNRVPSIRSLTESSDSVKSEATPLDLNGNRGEKLKTEGLPPKLPSFNSWKDDRY